MRRRQSQTDAEHGAVVAEFVMVLPVVILILGIALSALTLQLERIKLVSVASGLSRGVARGEPLAKLLELFDLGNRVLTWKNTDQLVCAELELAITLPGLGGIPLSIGDTECARKQGL